MECSGGSLEALEMALDDVAHEPAKGPKDDVIKDVLRRMLAVHRWIIYLYRSLNEFTENKLISLPHTFFVV